MFWGTCPIGLLTGMNDSSQATMDSPVTIGRGIIWTLDLTDDKSTMVQAMAWCRQATSHYLSQCWPRSTLPYGVTRPQWVNRTRCFIRSLYFYNRNSYTDHKRHIYAELKWCMSQKVMSYRNKHLSQCQHSFHLKAVLILAKGLLMVSCHFSDALVRHTSESPLPSSTHPITNSTLITMMTSFHGNTFCITGSLWGESTQV